MDRVWDTIKGHEATRQARHLFRIASIKARPAYAPLLDAFEGAGPAGRAGAALLAVAAAVALMVAASRVLGGVSGRKATGTRYVKGVRRTMRERKLSGRLSGDGELKATPSRKATKATPSRAGATPVRRSARTPTKAR